MLEEIWVTIKDYPMYKVSTFGRVKSIGRKSRWSDKIFLNERLLKTRMDKYGYEVVNLTNEKSEKTKKVHRLVAEAFISNPENKKEVNHIDGNKSNNAVINIEWNTMSENQLHRYHVLGVVAKKKIFGDKVIIDNSTGIFYPSVSSAAEARGLNRKNLERWLSGKYKNPTPFIYA